MRYPNIRRRLVAAVLVAIIGVGTATIAVAHPGDLDRDCGHTFLNYHWHDERCDWRDFVITPEPTPTPHPRPNWVYREARDAISGKQTHSASHFAGRHGISARCIPTDQDSLNVFVWFPDDSYISGNIYNNVRVQYRFESADPQDLWWKESNSKHAVFASFADEVEFALDLVYYKTLRFRSIAWHDGERYEAFFRFTGDDHPEHPVLKVLQACDRIWLPDGERTWQAK
ncbi:MAG: hypothetical protein OXP68_13885 [Anaerolineaceae bacterium]|nr:hypothetical protein [Anaerolineaceae bacterium]MDE0327936.1 hypothetical protein [Anaerolineaceae bacterium]